MTSERTEQEKVQDFMQPIAIRLPLSSERVPSARLGTIATRTSVNQSTTKHLKHKKRHTIANVAQEILSPG